MHIFDSSNQHTMATYDLPLNCKIFKSKTSMDSFTIRAVLVTQSETKFYDWFGQRMKNGSYMRGYNLPNWMGVNRREWRNELRCIANSNRNFYIYQNQNLPTSQKREDFVVCLRLEFSDDSPFTLEARQMITRLFEYEFGIVIGLERTIRLKELWRDEWWKGRITELFDKAVIHFETLFDDEKI